MAHLSYREDEDMMVVTVEGHVLLDNYCRAVDALVSTNTSTPNMDTIWDLRKADLSSLTTDNVREGAAMSIQSADRRGTYWKTALVVEGDPGFGLAEAWMKEESE